MGKIVKQETVVLRLKNMLAEFRKNNPDKYLSSDMAEYKIVSSTLLLSEKDGHKMTTSEKFEYLEFDKGIRLRPKRVMEEKQPQRVLKLKKMLAKFRKKNPDTYLASTMYEYKIVNTTPLFSEEDGHKMTVAEKFEYLGFDRGVLPAKGPKKTSFWISEKKDQTNRVLKLKKMLAQFRKKHPNTYLTSDMYEYKIVNNTALFSEKDGHKMTTSEKFEYLEFDRGVRPSPPKILKGAKQEENILKLKKMLAKFRREHPDTYLKSTTTEYNMIKITPIFSEEDGHSLSIPEKFEFLGFDRGVKPSRPIKSSEEIIDIFFEYCKENSSSNHPVCKLINSNDFAEKKLKKSEILKLCTKGYSGGKRRVMGSVMLDIFVAGGGNVDDLKPGDIEYDFLDFTAMTIDNKKLDIEEKFEACGHPREYLGKRSEKGKV